MVSNFAFVFFLQRNPPGKDDGGDKGEEEEDKKKVDGAEKNAANKKSNNNSNISKKNNSSKAAKVRRSASLGAAKANEKMANSNRSGSASRFRQTLANLLSSGPASVPADVNHTTTSTNTMPSSSKKLASLGRQRSDLSISNLRNYHPDVLPSAEDSDTLPVLLAVRRRRSHSDSGHETNSSHGGSPLLVGRAEARRGPAVDVETHPDASPSKKGSSGGRGIFRLFHRSATLLFNHPSQELNPDKPYKGTISMGNSKDPQRNGGGARSKKKPSTRIQNYHLHQDYSKSKVRQVNGENTHQPVSSTSSLNSSVMHHHLEHDEAASTSSGVGSESRTNNSSGTLQSQHQVPSSRIVVVRRAARRQGAHDNSNNSNNNNNVHSSSNSVISSVDSTIDSGAFSRTSTPDHQHGAAAAAASNLRHQSNLWKTNARSTLALAWPPLSAPSLVMEACGIRRRSVSNDAFFGARDTVDAEQILACLNAASENHNFASLQQQQQLRVPPMLRTSANGSNSNGAVSITIGASTSITIAPNSSTTGPRSLARVRSGMPLLGTSGLVNQSSSQSSSSAASTPTKPSRNASSSASSRSKISTVYLDSNRVTRSESSVALGAAARFGNRCCDEGAVTVNGQHHCKKSNWGNSHHHQRAEPFSSLTLPAKITDSSSSSDKGAKKKKRRAPPAPIKLDVESIAESQPGSLVHV